MEVVRTKPKFAGALVVALLTNTAVLGLATSARADDTSVERNYVAYYELTVSPGYRGGGAHWTDEDWTSIQCPSNTLNQNRVNTFIAGEDEQLDGGSVQLGYKKTKYYAGTQCTTDKYYYWEWTTATDTNKGVISSPSPIGTHDFNVNRLSTGCAVGSSWCWHFRIDGTDKHTCCYLPGVFTYAPDVTVQLECVDDNLNSDCSASGSLIIDGFQYKDTTNNWLDWQGEDYICVDYNESARGKWLSDISGDAGYNVSISGTGTNEC